MMPPKVAVFLAALALLTEARDPDSLLRAQQAFVRQNFALAEREARAATAEQPRNAGAQRLLGMIYVAQGRFNEAERPLNSACELNPGDELNCYYAGRNDYALGKYARSKSVLEGALKRFNSSDRIRIGLALTLEALGDITEAERLLEHASRMNSPSALSEYGQFLFRQGRLGESIEVLRRSGNQEALDRALKQRQASSTGASGFEPAAVTFARTELPMQVRAGGTGRKHLIETMIGGVAVLDYDNDGWPDIYVTNGAELSSLVKSDSSYTNRLFRNNHDGTFQDVTGNAGVGGTGFSMGVAAADYDNDGFTDLFVTGVRTNTLYRNRGDGTFEDVTKQAGLASDGRWTVSAGWFDYDNDGKLDLFLVRYVAWDPRTEQRCGTPDAPSYCHPRFYAPLPNALFHNEGGGTFRDVSVESGIAAHPGKGMGLAFADYDHDGRMDVFVTNDTVPNFLFHNLGGGRFEEVATAAGVAWNGDGRVTSAMGVDFRDYDNDGFDDLFITNLSNETYSLFRNTGSGSFVDRSAVSKVASATLRAAGWSALMADFNGDGWKDLFAAGGHVDDNIEKTTSLESRQANMIFANRGDGTFAASALPGKALHRGAALGDFNLDGKMDVVVTRLNETPVVLTNRTAAAHHWLMVRLRGRQSNRDGIGAGIKITTAAGSQTNHISTSVGYGSSSQAVAHFGLGGNAKVQRIEVFWPSGIRQSVENVRADQSVVLDEPR